MPNAAKAYLKTTGQETYRGCTIAYYTYSMFDLPAEYRINVNVHIQDTKLNTIKTLAIDEVFAKESLAINFGITQAKLYIDAVYTTGKIKAIPAQDKKTSYRSGKT